MQSVRWSARVSSSRAISGHQGPSVAISGHQWPSVTISGQQMQSPERPKMDRVERERSFHIVERVEVTPLQVAKGRALIPCFGPIGRLCKHLMRDAIRGHSARQRQAPDRAVRARLRAVPTQPASRPSVATHRDSSPEIRHRRFVTGDSSHSDPIREKHSDVT